jgi:tetratricopeptide (TPR) repeat protein
VSATYQWDWRAAEAGFHKALALNPGVSEIHHRYAFYYLILHGRFEEAARQVQRAKSLDPLSVVFNAAECLSLFWARQYDPPLRAGWQPLRWSLRTR